MARAIRGRRYPPSPTTLKGAQKIGCASENSGLPLPASVAPGPSNLFIRIP